MEYDSTMMEIKQIRKDISLRRLSHTAEENAKHDHEIREWAELKLGRKFVTIGESQHSNIPLEELAQV